MNLFDTGNRDAPSRWAYEHRESIREDQRCDVCEGLGVVRWRHSQVGNDWRTCFACRGTGTDGRLERVERKLDRI